MLNFFFLSTNSTFTFFPLLVDWAFSPLKFVIGSAALPVQTAFRMMMKLQSFFTLLAALLVTCRAQDRSTYCRLSSQHTMCRFQVRIFHHRHYKSRHAIWSPFDSFDKENSSIAFRNLSESYFQTVYQMTGIPFATKSNQGGICGSCRISVERKREIS